MNLGARILKLKTEVLGMTVFMISVTFKIIAPPDSVCGKEVMTKSSAKKNVFLEEQVLHLANSIQ